MHQAREFAERAEKSPILPSGHDERFAGYGVMGLPFGSGHVLAMRRFPASSVGEPYTSVWHRDPAGRWTFYSDQPPLQACTRYFGADVSEAIETAIEVNWLAPERFRVVVPEVLDWELQLAQPAIIRMMNATAGLLSDDLWMQPRVLDAMGAAARRLLHTGEMNLHGTTPNGQHFVANPLEIWTIVESRATLRGHDLGRPAPLPEQATLGDFRIPQRGLFVRGRAFFEPFDSTRHKAVVAGAA